MSLPNQSPAVPELVDRDAEPTFIRQNAPSAWIGKTVFTALFAALFIAFSYVSVPLGFTTVPITLQTLAVMLAGGLLGARLGFSSIALVVLLAAAGLPLLHGRGGLATVFGPTGGFIWMFPLQALFIGMTADRLLGKGRKATTRTYVLLAASIVVFGIALSYVGGVPWYAYKAHLSLHAALIGACYPFLPGDFVKGAAAMILIAALRPALAVTLRRLSGR
ncbi:biotin transporter BioY [Cohnella rhizosphaerae]|uniref:Biotin transporter BioY n=1 Tax=Cohnella rhizosphaerae TaxID=1457232 RepID=A0A9X4KWH0_9BACL|nr:biotin transporter BioY [Cohnella rhizosphaerae]MDG0812509.1 biotin transporter BioY [Cohnella rhizosphaerae]